MLNLNLLKRIYLQILIIWLLLLIIITFLLTNPYDNVSPEEYNETYSNYFKSEATLTYGNVTPTKHLFDLLNFTFLINPGVEFRDEIGANNTEIKAVFIVTSHIMNVETRSAMRRAFPSDALHTLGVRRVFLLGITPDNKYINQKAIEDEANRYGDIVQGNFLEAYRNLTYKHVMGLKWASEYCNKAKYVIKMDDDIIVNVLKMLDLLKMFNSKETFISGYVLEGLQAKRERANKWFVTKEEYPLDTYPKFVSGWLYITTPAVCNKLVKLSETVKYFWIDDVYITGILAEKIHVKTYDIKRYFTDHPEYFQCCLNDLKKYNFDCDILVGPNGGRTNLFYEFNEAFSTCVKNKCIKRLFPMSQTCVGTKTVNLGRGNGVISTYNLVK